MYFDCLYSHAFCRGGCFITTTTFVFCIEVKLSLLSGLLRPLVDKLVLLALLLLFFKEERSAKMHAALAKAREVQRVRLEAKKAEKQAGADGNHFAFLSVPSL